MTATEKEINEIVLFAIVIKSWYRSNKGRNLHNENFRPQKTLKKITEDGKTSLMVTLHFFILFSCTVY